MRSTDLSRLTDEEQLMRKFLVNLLCIKGCDMQYFPLTSSVMVQTQDKAHTVFIGGNQFSYTNTTVFIDNRISNDFSSVLMNEVEWRIEKKRQVTKSMVFDKKVHIFKRVIEITDQMKKK